ncbi:unnamed protein product [Penicillium salamii]|uniref:Uncharacterized protein n=1 Tax=Penicillium salamii TaxID=1612424 RepID=A0A9W4NX06_9EURO|nr:unnamed protein product [Penicillium salamii]
MPGEPKPAQKRPRLPFKPPSRTTSAGPSEAPKAKSKPKQTGTKASASNAAPSTTKNTQSKATKSTTTKRPRVESPAPDEAQSGSESASDASGRNRSRSLSQEPDYILAEITTTNPVEDVTSSDPKIPPKLLTRLLHEHFQNDKTKVAKDANNVVAKYVDVFVREAIARAAFERAETNDNAESRRVGDGFLEVGHDRILKWRHGAILISDTGRGSRKNGATAYDGLLAFGCSGYGVWF